MLSTTEEHLRDKFLEVAGAGDQAIERVKKISDYAFIHFKDRDVAQKCLQKLNGTLTSPISYTKYPIFFHFYNLQDNIAHSIGN